jgi:hypothetical protein
MQRDFSPMNTAELMDSVIDIFKKSFGKQIAFAAIVYVIAIAGTIALTFVFAILLMFFSFSAISGGSSAGGAFFLVGGTVVMLMPVFALASVFEFGTYFAFAASLLRIQNSN